MIPLSVFILIMLAWSGPDPVVIGHLVLLAALAAVVAWLLLRLRVNAVLVALVACAGLHRAAGPFLTQPLSGRSAGAVLAIAGLVALLALAADRLLRRMKPARQRWLAAPALGLLMAACGATIAPPPRTTEPGGMSFDSQVTNKMTAAQWLNLSLESFRAKKYLESVAASQTAIRLQPDYAEAHNNLAASYSALRLWDLAIPEAQEALRLRPDFGLARNNLNWATEQKRLETQPR